jgi:hypothetical protein
MMKYLPVLLGAGCVLSALVLSSSPAPAGDEPVGAPATVPDVNPSAEEAAARADALRDPAFARFVDLSSLAPALQEGNAATVLDLALQLAEGERVLLRPHKSLRSDTLLRAALRLAVQKRDRETLERLEKFAQQRGSAEWKELVANARKTADSGRAVKLSLAVAADDDMDAQRLLTVRAFNRAIEQEEAVGNRAALKQLLETLDGCGLKKAELEMLRKKATDALERLPEGSADAEALQKLLGPTRGTSKGWVGPKQNGTLKFDGDSYILLSFTYSGQWTHDDLSTAYWSVQADAVKHGYTAPLEQTVNVSRAQSPVCFGYYNVTKKTGSYCLVTGTIKDSHGRYGYCQTMEWSGKITTKNGWTPPYDWNPVSGTRYHHRLSYGSDNAGGFQFIFRTPVR